MRDTLYTRCGWVIGMCQDGESTATGSEAQHRKNNPGIDVIVPAPVVQKCQLGRQQVFGYFFFFNSRYCYWARLMLAYNLGKQLSKAGVVHCLH